MDYHSPDASFLWKVSLIKKLWEAVFTKEKEKRDKENNIKEEREVIKKVRTLQEKVILKADFQSL